MTLTVRLPFPASALLPNRAHRKGGMAARRFAASQARCWGMLAALEARQAHPRAAFPFTEVALLYRFSHPRQSAPDLDNLIAACKPYLDGLVQAGILADDGPRIVQRIEAEYRFGAETEMEIRIIGRVGDDG